MGRIRGCDLKKKLHNFEQIGQVRKLKFLPFSELAQPFPVADSIFCILAAAAGAQFIKGQGIARFGGRVQHLPKYFHILF
jgi:hypothetical protein